METPIDMDRMRLELMKGGGDVSKYRDPKTTKIEDWKWRKMQDVRKDMPIIEVPDYVQKNYGEFMNQQLARAQAAGLTTRDLLKAFTITQSSIGRGGLSHATATKTGMKLPNTGDEVRPEGAFAEWLGSPMGQSYLNAAERGMVHQPALNDVRQKFSPFGKHNQLTDQMIYAAQNMPAMSQNLNQAITGSKDDYRDFAEKMKGVAGAKSGFIGSMLGRGDLPTLDARQLNLHSLPANVGIGSIMNRGKGQGAREAVDRLASRQSAMNLKIDPAMQPHYQHLAHHAVWDASGNNQTTHNDIIKAMRGYAEGGDVNPFDYENPEHVTNVAGHISKHKDFNKIPDVHKHMGEMLSAGNHKYLEDPRVQQGMRKAGHNAYYVQEKTGKKMHPLTPNVIKKAVGGAVPSVNEMRAELATKRPTSLSDMTKIGAMEAPNMNVKEYLPPKNDGTPMPVGGVDMSPQQTGDQLLPQSLVPKQPPEGQPPQGAEQQGMPSPLGGGAPPQQAPSNILQMTPQGQAMNAMTPPKAPPQMADGGSVSSSWMPDNNAPFDINDINLLKDGGQPPKVEVRPTVFDDKASRRNPKIEAAARALMEGDMKQKAYAKVVAKEKPVKPYEFIPKPATDKDAMRALHEPKKAKWRGHESWPAGHRVGLRLDIPAYEDHGVWVNSIHDESGGEKKLATSYGPVSSVRNAEFQGSPHKAVRVATGEQNKAPFAKIMGDLEHMTEDQAVKHFQKYFNHPDYRQVGYDPRRHGDFYDRETMEPITHAEHVVQIGPLVLAKKPKYGKREVYAKGGSAKPKKPLYYGPSPTLSKADIEAHAERMARQVSGQENPTGKTLQQMAREKDLQVGIESSKKNETPIIDYGNLKGSYSVGVPGDTSRGGVMPTNNSNMDSPEAGEYLKSIGFETLEQPVGLYGGKDYGAYGHPAGWASDLGASRGMFNVVKRLAKDNPEMDVYGHYHKMSPEALYHAVHMLDSVLAHHQPHKLPKEQIEQLNHLMRNVKLTTNKNDKPYPDFPGFENPSDIRLQAPFNSGMRKKIISMLGKEKYMAGGKQKLDDIIYAISHPELRDIETGAGGSSIIKFDPNRSLKESISPHPTYGHDIPSKLVGRTRYTTPADILAPRSMHNARQEIARMGKKVVPFNQAKMNIIREPIDEQYINQMGEYELAMKKRLGYKKGGKVNLSTNMDIMNLELSRKSKKAK